MLAIQWPKSARVHLWKKGLTTDTPENHYEASVWYLLAARQGYPPAMLELAVLQWNDGQKQPALQWLSLAAQRGDENARTLLMQMGEQIQDIEGILASEAYQDYRSWMLIDGVHSLGQALGCSIGGGCSNNRALADSNDRLAYSANREQRIYSLFNSPSAHTRPITSPYYFAPPGDITSPDYFSPQNRQLRSLTSPTILDLQLP